MKLFNTFFVGGYECADHINRSGERINLLKETGHDIRVEEDYKALASIGIRTVREGICWSSVERTAGVFDFSEVKNRMEAAEKFGIQQIWDLIHFGYPTDIYPTHPQFCIRFKKLCEAFAHFYKANSRDTLFVVPINEISFLSWHSGDVRGTTPFLVNSGWDIKYHLCMAAIQGIKVLKSIIPECRIIMVEPLIHVHGNILEDNTAHITELNENQFQAMDIIGGRMCPELGGCEEFLDILGFNYYWDCQWEVNSKPLAWPENQNRIPLSELLMMVYSRYKKPIFLSETGNYGEGRVPWMEEVTAECMKAYRNGVELVGICIYPVTDRPDWDRLESYCRCGLWDLDEKGNRIPHAPYIVSVIRSQILFSSRKEITFLSA